MNRAHIQQLIDRYLDGLTTDREEQQMRRYFARLDIVPDEWRPYRALFAFTAQEGAGQTSRRQPGLWRWGLSAAAAVVLLVTLSLVWPRTTRDCAYIDGRRTTDAAVIRQEAEAALSLVSTQEEDIFSIMNSEI